MKFVGRRDRLLTAGLAFALVVVFAKPIRHLLGLTRGAEEQGALGPALIILVLVFLFQQGKDQEAKTGIAVA